MLIHLACMQWKCIVSEHHVWMTQVYFDAALLKNEGDVMRDAQHAFGYVSSLPLTSAAEIESASDLVWEHVQVHTPLALIHPHPILYTLHTSFASGNTAITTICHNQRQRLVHSLQSRVPQQCTNRKLA